MGVSAAVLAGSLGASTATVGSIAATAGAVSGAASAVGGWGTILSLAGTGISAISSMRQGQASEASARYNAQVAQNNAKIAQQNMNYAAAEGNQAVARQQMENRAKMGAIKAGQGASGVDVTSPSFVDVRSSARETGQLSAIDIRNAAVRKAYGYKTQEADFKAEAQMELAEGKAAGQAGKIDAASTLLGGVYDANKSYNNYLTSRGTM